MIDQHLPIHEVPDLDVSIGLQDTGGANWVLDGDVLLAVIYLTIITFP